MVCREKLNLIGVVSPVCLLKCKRVLSEMDAGDVLEVLLQDPDVVEELVKIVERSSDRVMKLNREQDHFRIQLERGSDIC